MSRKYKFHNKEGIYFVSFAVVYWIDVFTRNGYNASFLEILRHYQQEGRLALYAYCVMPSHVHLVFSDREKMPEALIGNIKRFSSQKLQKEIEDNPQESRKEWLLWMHQNQAM